MSHNNDFENFTARTNSTHEGDNDRQPRISRRALFGIGAASVATIIGVKKFQDYHADYVSEHRPGTINEDSILDLNVRGVVLQEDARLRSDPDLPFVFDDANILATVNTPDDQGLLIDTPGGAYETYNYKNSNNWIGIPVEDLAEDFDPKNFTVDADGIVWVSTQKAYPRYPTDDKD